MEQQAEKRLVSDHERARLIGKQRWLVEQAKEDIKKIDDEIKEVKARRTEAMAELRVAEAKLDEFCVEAMEVLDLPLWHRSDKGQAVKKEMDEAAAEIWPAETKETEDLSWKKVKLADLKEPQIPAKILKALEEAEVITMGDLTERQGTKADFWAKDIKGLGQAGQGKIADATEAFWLRRNEHVKITNSEKAKRLIALEKFEGLEVRQVKAACVDNNRLTDAKEGGEIIEVKTVLACDEERYVVVGITEDENGFTAEAYKLATMDGVKIPCDQVPCTWKYYGIAVEVNGNIQSLVDPVYIVKKQGK